MRLLLLIAWLVVPAWALAKPTLAVAPLTGDKGGKVAKVIAEAADEEAKVVGPARVEAAMAKLSIEEIDGRAVKKLRKKLDVEVIVFGGVERASGRTTVSLKISARGKKTQSVELQFKELDAKFKRELSRELARQLGAGERDDSNTDEEEEEKPRKKVGKKGGRDDEGEGDEARDGGDDGDRVRKRRKRDDDDGDDEAPARLLTTQSAVRLDAGLGFARRTLTYGYAQATAPDYPPGVGTAGASAKLEAEVYPGSFDTLRGAAANVGIVASYEQTFGVSIDVPGTSVTSPVSQSKYEIGARYRIPFGTSVVAFGVSYWHRQYTMSRDGLTMPTQLDAPDTTYSALSPHAILRYGASKELAIFASVAGQLVLGTGEIQNDDSYGPASVVAFELEGGIDYKVGKNIAVHAAAELGQVGMTFTRKTGTMALARGVGSATDRVVGASLSLSVLY